MKRFVFFCLILTLLIPAVADAQFSGGITTLLESSLGIVDSLVKVSFGLGLLFFFWGIAKFILAAGDESKHEEGKRLMIWGIVALFVMASVWGIVNFVQTAVFSRTIQSSGQSTSDTPTQINTQSFKIQFQSN
jgi:hypothetical protein